MTNDATARRVLLWAAFLAYGAAVMAYQPLQAFSLLTVGSVDIFVSDLLLLLAGILGIGTLMRISTSQTDGAVRFVSRIILAYLLYQILVVLPVSLLDGSASLANVVRTASVRFVWLLFPAVVSICQSTRARRLAGVLPIFAAGLVSIWGLLVLAAGGGGFYLDGTDIRFRILWGGATLLFGWPIVVAASGLTRKALTIPLVAIAVVGVALTNHRSGLIAVALALLVVFVLTGRGGRGAVWAVWALGAAGVVSLVWADRVREMFGYVFTHLLDVSTGNGADRTMRGALAWDYFLSRPFGDFLWSWRYYAVDLPNPYGPHNAFLDVATVEGVAGLAFYAGVLVYPLRRAWRWLRRDAEMRAIVGYIVLFVVFGLGNETWYNLVCLPLLVAAVAAVVSRVDQLALLESASVSER